MHGRSLTRDAAAHSVFPSAPEGLRADMLAPAGIVTEHRAVRHEPSMCSPARLLELGSMPRTASSRLTPSARARR